MGTKIKPKCLLVDDLSENLIALKALLAEANVECVTALSGEIALSHLLESDFALALIDIQMPQMDGYELAEIMRSTTKTKFIPIIFITAASTDSERIFKGYEVGAVDFMPKPFNSQILLGKVRVFLMLHVQKLMLEDKLEMIQETEKSLQIVLKSKDEFLAICSHELKTPLTSLKLQIQLNNRKREKLGDELVFSVSSMKKFMTDCEHSVDRMIYLVNEMLDLSKITSESLELMIVEVNIGDLLINVVEKMHPHLNTAGCKTTLDIQHNVLVKCDPFKIEQVITNFLINAGKYAPDSLVEISLTASDDEAIIKVKDHGPGINEQDLERIFEKYERAIPYTLISGLGLGLFISKEIVEKHKGSISVESTFGHGATFIVKLPLK